MNIMNLQPYLTFARQLAYRAGRITLSYYNKRIQHDLKQDESPVTAADQATEEFIRAEIERTYPSHAIVGEEFGEKAGEGNPFRWRIFYMPPMDSAAGGTANGLMSLK